MAGRAAAFGRRIEVIGPLGVTHFGAPCCSTLTRVAPDGGECDHEPSLVNANR
jgi:hypothetical protein